MINIDKKNTRLSVCKYLAAIFFIILAFSLSRQAPLNQYPFILPLSLVAYIFFQLLSDQFSHKVPKHSVILFISILVFFLFWAVLHGNAPKLIFRFFIIIFLLNFILFLNVNNNKYVDYLKNIYVIQSIIVVALGVSLPFLFSLDTYSPVRFFVKNYDWGDIYTYNGYFYRIQLVGNALLPFLFFILYDQYRSNGKGITTLLLVLFSVLFAGNLAFFIAVFLFVFLYEASKVKVISSRVSIYKLFFWGGFILLCPIVITYFIQLILMKSTGDVSSIGTRFDQFRVLINDMNLNYFTVFFGQGLGNTIDVVTQHRDYSGNIYFELQFFYFLNQIGVIGMFLFLYVHIVLFLQRIKNKIHILMYCCYLFYGFINPYMFDTTHIVVLVILISMSTHRKTNKPDY